MFTWCRRKVKKIKKVHRGGRGLLVCPANWERDGGENGEPDCWAEEKGIKVFPSGRGEGQGEVSVS